MNKQNFLKIVKNNIEKYSFHVTVVQAKECPRFAYTIGNYEKYNFEFIIAGNVNFLYEDLISIFNEIIHKIGDFFFNENIAIQSKFGSFTFRKVHPSWSKKMMLGVYDYYDIDDFEAYQIIPDSTHFTLDIPNMLIAWNPQNQPIWKWLENDILWNLGVPKNSVVITDLKSLFGKNITEVMRWEEDSWEAFTQNSEEILEEEIRVVPISVLLAIDNTLKPILKLDIGKGFFRDEESMEWNDWG